MLPPALIFTQMLEMNLEKENRRTKVRILSQYTFIVSFTGGANVPTRLIRMLCVWWCWYIYFTYVLLPSLVVPC
jgi:hypothetical protein